MKKKTYKIKIMVRLCILFSGLKFRLDILKMQKKKVK